MSYRLKITLPDGANEHLRKLAERLDEPVARIAANLVLAQIGCPISRRECCVLLNIDGDHASWLEAEDDSSPAHTTLLPAVERLVTRYPEHLAGLRRDWWQIGHHKETLCALAAWRLLIDKCGQDPREELAFQASLADCTKRLMKGRTCEVGAGASRTQAGGPA